MLGQKVRKTNITAWFIGFMVQLRGEKLKFQCLNAKPVNGMSLNAKNTNL